MNVKAFGTGALLALLAGTPASAQHGVVGHYDARLSARDHFNTGGARLRTVAAILRQDRANFHRFGRGDAEDQADPYFAFASNREALERLIARGRIDPAAANAILNGEPLVHVDIYRDYVVVTLR